MIYSVIMSVILSIWIRDGASFDMNGERSDIIYNTERK